ncbi:general secretion pathway protein C [Sphingomonas laterariae]|uniref:General secretion pathway protein C n=1 Tax=Edaphosphingomonas laterariae TaxID=861865 RepID=A0A239JDM6_9SPHN|nr:type II secretion system protein N [Sphingomonas laterariae]SNT03940.1 general secretion pathway protein C [Sphingomonas laterariae]
MQLSLDRRAQRLLRRLPRYSVYHLAEVALIALLAVQGARLVYAAITPVDPVGDWRAGAAADGTGASATILGSFDPFFRLSNAQGPVVITALDISLFGTRADQASGRGSAIIGLPDGSQASFAVGEEIMPGVTLKAVGFDSITVQRGAAEEMVYLDQSTPAEGATPAPAAGAPVGPGLAGLPTDAMIAGAPPPPLSLMDETQATPRLQGGAVTGVVLQPKGGGAAFRAAGLQPGDVLVSVEGQRVGDAGAANQLQSRLSQGGEVAVEVERGGRIVALRVKAGQ